MRRRQGFTLVELLVAMALIIFIMAILSQAFSAAMTTFRNLKASGDMAEKLRATTQLLYRDLAADHFEGKKRLSDTNFWVNGPPEQGFFQISQGNQGISEGLDLDGIGSYHTTTHALSFTVKLRGNQMGDFLSASGGMAALSAKFGPAEARYQSTSGGSYNYQWAAVAWFLQPSINPTTGLQDTTVADPTVPGSAAVPLYTLYRRQALLVPDNSLVSTAQPAGNVSQFQEVSCWPNGGNLYFNNPIDITCPSRRYWGGAAAYTPIAQGQGTLSGSDMQLNDVVSFDVRMLAVGAPAVVDPFATLFQPPFTGAGSTFTYTAPPGQAGMVFDTWSSLSDSLTNPPYSTWNQLSPAVPGVTIPFWNGTSGPIIQAIQVTIRIWDYKTNQTRQVTIVQAM